MKSRFQGSIFLFLMLLGVAGVSAQDINEDLSGFSEVKVYNGVEVELIPSERNSISITGHSKEKVKFEVVENRLEIRLSLENIWADDNTRVTVYASGVEVIDANEGSIVEVKEKLQGPRLTFRAQEGAAIYVHFQLRAEDDDESQPEAQYPDVYEIQQKTFGSKAQVIAFVEFLYLWHLLVLQYSFGLDELNDPVGDKDSAAEDKEGGVVLDPVQ